MHFNRMIKFDVLFYCVFDYHTFINISHYFDLFTGLNYFKLCFKLLSLEGLVVKFIKCIKYNIFIAK